MWGLFVGIAIGAAQVLALKLLGSILLGDKKTWTKLVAAALLAAKIALIVFILYMMHGISMAHLIWTAGGMLIGLIAALAVLVLRQKKQHREDNDGD